MKRLRNAPSRPLSHCPSVRCGPSTKTWLLKHMNTYLRTLAHGSGELFYLPQNACLSKLPFRALLPCARDRGVSDVHAPALEENLASTHGNASRMRARTTKKNIVMHAQHYSTSISLLSMTKRSCQAVVSPEEKNKKMEKKNTMEQPVTSASSRPGRDEEEQRQRPLAPGGPWPPSLPLFLPFPPGPTPLHCALCPPIDPTTSDGKCRVDEEEHVSPRSPAPPGGERQSFTQTEQERVRLRRRRAGGPRMGLSTNGMTMHWQASPVPASGSTYAAGDEDGRWRWRWEMGRAVRCGGGLDVLFTACGRHANYTSVLISSSTWSRA
ncbi:hypothetical protein PCL_00521 [Purpureocillium lilacinum]|uniref:Uncharacterized protein n=1 Tax=Purpureocillium lilacinum TaxID=33203 RepID=A0A2U3E550_PURLI|nr:hypothetical protein PCL_00521 [Purpureocillium lilacinum]